MHQVGTKNACIKVKLLWIIAATTRPFCRWVGMFLEKRLLYISCGKCNMVVASKDKGYVSKIQEHSKGLEWDFRSKSLHKKWSFPLRISPVNVSKSAGNWRFGHIYWRNPQWKTSFFVQWILSAVVRSWLEDQRHITGISLGRSSTC